jgi:hypothetical protein
VATVCRRVFADVSVLAVRWPLMCSTRLSSSMGALATQDRHSVRIVSAGARPNAVRPFAVNCNRPPVNSANPAAWISNGQANPRDRLRGVEIASGQNLSDRRDGGSGRPLGLLAGP